MDSSFRWNDGSTIDRRGFVAAGSAAFLSACATTGTRREQACSALPPVNVDPSRVVRTVAGLRPYRASGFVVRRDPFGGKAVAHNYGHGGAGITLSWGSSRLATNLGLPGHSGPVAVIGAGVMGLIAAADPGMAKGIGEGMTAYLRGIPEELYALFGTGYLGYTAARQWGKIKGVER